MRDDADDEQEDREEHKVANQASPDRVRRDRLGWIGPSEGALPTDSTLPFVE